MATTYVDSSALLKLAVREPETAALEAHLAAADGLVGVATRGARVQTSGSSRISPATSADG